MWKESVAISIQSYLDISEVKSNFTYSWVLLGPMDPQRTLESVVGSFYGMVGIIRQEKDLPRQKKTLHWHAKLTTTYATITLLAQRIVQKSCSRSVARLQPGCAQLD